MNLKELIINAKKIALIFDLDTDGVSSAKIVYEAINRMQKEISDFFPSPSGNLNDDSLIAGIKNANPDLLIIVDDELRKDSLIVKNFKFNILVIDHHSIQDMPKGENIFYYNPKINGDLTYTPASKYCFDLFSKIVNIEDLDWIAAVGIISDSGAIHHKDFLKKVFKKYLEEIKEDKDYLSDSFFGYLGDIINTGKIVKGNDGALMALRVLQNSSSPKDFLENAYELRNLCDEVNSYIKEITEDFELKKETYENLDLYFYTFSPKYKIGSVLSTIVSFKHPNKTVIIFSKKSKIVSVSYRRQDKKVDMNVLARESIKGLKSAGGGGHVPAAGGHVQTKDVNVLKRNIISILKKEQNKNA
ncbi:MAG: DHHA1 domain-containing protein [Candidatus Nanoarchaeia archaeon]|nr:DHHA1 domain-containing protein [Candidatus Nanoarchaeia archaeon]